MERLPKIVTALGAFAVVLMVVLAAGCSPKQTEVSSPGTDFRDFSLATSRPYHTPEDAVAHRDTWHNIRVNDVGIDSYLGRNATVPVGTVVIKEDFANADGAPGDFQKYLVMAKMAPGYDPDNGDWYYSVRMPDDQPVEMNGMKMEGRIPMCVGCHTRVAATDYLFGPPDSVRVER